MIDNEIIRAFECCEYSVGVFEIDNLVKEMVGAESG